MASMKQRSDKRKEEQDLAHDYDLRTPRWQEYYRKVRATVRFPRYYKKALNA